MKKIIFLIAALLLIAFLSSQFPYSLSTGDDKMHLLYLGALLSIFTLSARSLPLNQTIKYIAAWVGVFIVIIFAYSYKDEFLSSRFAATLLPNRAIVNAEGNLAIRASNGGHFYIEAKVNGVKINFMIDTGASDVALSKEDAKRIGINPLELSYTRSYMTANGVTGGAPIKLKRLQIGDFILDDFPASVNKGELQTSLLGMSALRSFGGFSVEGDIMTIGNRKEAAP